MTRIVIIFTLLFTAQVWGTDTNPVDTVTVDSMPTIATSEEVAVQIDTALYRQDPGIGQFLPVTSSVNLEEQLSQNPTGALLKSMIVPGWGQFGNRKYIKAGVFFALQVRFVSSAFKHKRDATDLWDQYLTSSDLETRNEFYDQYKIAKDDRNRATWFAVMVAFLSMFDAYVDAHLSGFPKVDAVELGFDITSPEDGTISATFSLSL